MSELVAELLQREVAVLNMVLTAVVKDEPRCSQSVQGRVFVFRLHVFDSRSAVGWLWQLK